MAKINKTTGLSRTMSVFKDFPGLENLEKKNSRTFKDRQEPCTPQINKGNQTY